MADADASVRGLMVCNLYNQASSLLFPVSYRPTTGGGCWLVTINMFITTRDKGAFLIFFYSELSI